MSLRSLTIGVGIVLAILFVFATPAAGAEPPDEVVNRTYGGNATDGVTDILPTADGNYLLVGFTDEAPGDGFAVKVTPNGSQLWNRTYGGPRDDSLLGGVRTADGGYALAGWTNVTNTSDTDGWVVKVDSNGEQQWASTYGGNQTDWFEDIEETPSGELMLVGTFGNESDDDLWIAKTRSNGSQLWGFVYWDEARSGNELAYAIERTPSNTYLIAGEEYVQQADNWDGLGLEINESGDIEWLGRFGHDEQHDGLADVATNDSGHAYFVGLRNAVWNGTRADYDSADAWLLSVDDTRGVASGTTLNVGAYNRFDGVDVSESAVLAGGSWNEHATSDSDALGVRFSPDGTETWNVTPGGSADEEFDSVQLADGGGYYLAGDTSSFGAEAQDGWLVKLDRAGPPPVSGDRTPTDIDGDGKFEDLNGDGRFSIVDVQLLFTNRNEAVIGDNADAFDFNGDGRFTIVDVQRLFVDFRQG